MHRIDKYSQYSSIIWPVWLNGQVFVYELSGCGFESRCCHLIYYSLLEKLNTRIRSVVCHKDQYQATTIFNIRVFKQHPNIFSEHCLLLSPFCFSRRSRNICSRKSAHQILKTINIKMAAMILQFYVTGRGYFRQFKGQDI